MASQFGYTLDGEPLERPLDAWLAEDELLSDEEIARAKALQPGETLILGGGAFGEFILARDNGPDACPDCGGDGLQGDRGTAFPVKCDACVGTGSVQAEHGAIASLVAGWPDLKVWDAQVATRWLLRVQAVFGAGFHPDTPFADYRKPNGSRLFTDKDVEVLDKTMEAVFGLLPDPYAVCMDAKARGQS